MRLRTLCALAAGLLFASGSAFAAPVLLIDPIVSTVTVGASSTLNVRIDDAVDLYAIQFDLGFNPAVLAATSVTEGPFLPTAGSTFFVPGNIDNSSGSVSFVANSLLTAINGITGSGVVATINYTALTPGSSPFSLFNVTLLDSSLSSIPFTAQGGSVNTQAPPVPEPAFLSLFGLGLLAERMRRRARRSREPVS